MLVLLTACAGNPEQRQRFTQVQREVNEELARSQTNCPPPAGTFENLGHSLTTSESARLSALLFADGLAGYPVEAISIERQPNTNTLLITGVLGGTKLLRYLELHAETSVPCQQRWRLMFDNPQVNASMRTEAALWTGGLLLPVKESNQVFLVIARNHSLLVNVINTSWAAGAFIIPLKWTDEDWYRFLPYQTSPMAKVTP